MFVREANSEELDLIFMMGFDIWGNDDLESIYLDECHKSQKYKKGEWFVLIVEGEVVSSLIVYKNGFNLIDGCYGISSVATTPKHRKKGYASNLFESVSNKIKNSGAKGIYLFSDIEKTFYENLGYELVKQKQPYSDSPCMVYAFREHETLLNAVPKYF